MSAITQSQREGGQKALTEITQLRVRVENATKEIEEDYNRIRQTVQTLKQKMNEIEQRLSQKKTTKGTNEDTKSLRAVMKSLDRLTDRQILKSKVAWKKYEQLKHNCRTHASDLPELEELRVLCKKTEQLAADLLCYSLGFVKRKNV